MRWLLTVSPVLAAVQSVFSIENKTPYKPVSYTDAPSYYPGAPWKFQAAETRPSICKVVSAGDGQDSAPLIIEAFEKCGHNGKVILDADLCTLR